MATNITHYDMGDVWQPQATFTQGGTATDVTNVSVTYKKPDGTTATIGPYSGATGGANLTRVSAGLYRASITFDQVGYWFARFVATGVGAATEEHEAIVDPSEVLGDGLSTRALVGLAQTKAYLRQKQVDTTDDLVLVDLINDASELFQRESGREIKVVGTNPQTRIFELSAADYGMREVRVGDMASAPTVVTVTDTSGVVLAVAGTDWVAEPRVRQEWEPITRLVFPSYTVAPATLATNYLVTVTGNFGFPAVPSSVKRAVMETVASAFDADVEHWRGDLGAVSDQNEGGTTVVFAGRPQITTMPPRAWAVAQDFRELMLV